MGSRQGGASVHTTVFGQFSFRTYIYFKEELHQVIQALLQILRTREPRPPRHSNFIIIATPFFLLRHLKDVLCA